MKNQSDILLAPEVGRVGGTHTPHFHHTICFSYEKRAKSCMSSESWNGNWYTSRCTFISLYLFLSQCETHPCTLTFVTVIRCEARRYVTSVKPPPHPPRGNGTYLALCNIQTWRLCISWENEIEIWSVHHALGWWQHICGGIVSPPSSYVGLWDTCVAMWRTLLAVLPEIANPLSLEMSCVAWPRTTQVRTSHPPRSQALSLQYSAVCFQLEK